MQLLSESRNNRMNHIEDMVLYGGVRGAFSSINAMRELWRTLQGKHKQEVSVKWDGAPSIFAGTDPIDGKFFVATKRIFKKTPEVYKTKAEIDGASSGDLNTKLTLALELFPSLGIKGVIQGDFLFGPDDVKDKIISGDRYTTFHPNTIVYAVPSKSEEAKQIKGAKVGVVWHTRYEGRSLHKLVTTGTVDISTLTKIKSVWMQDGNLNDMSSATLSSKGTAMVDFHLKNAERIFKAVANGPLKDLESNPEMQRWIEIYNNTYVKRGIVIHNSTRHSEALLPWILSRCKNERQKKRVHEFFKKNAKRLPAVFDLQKELTLAKIILINKLNELSKFDTFIKTDRGYKVTDQEGFVVVDKIGGDTVKLVNRMEFTYNNFSPDVLRGWSSSRN